MQQSYFRKYTNNNALFLDVDCQHFLRYMRANSPHPTEGEEEFRPRRFSEIGSQINSAMRYWPIMLI